MNEKVLLIFAVCILLAHGAKVEAAEGQSTILTVEKTNESISIDGYVSENSWKSARKLVVTVRDGGIGTVDVTLRALYDYDYIYIAAEWSDPTESVTKDLWKFSDGRWSYSGDEDRISFFWNINDSIAGFNVGGCAMLCHGDRMHTNSLSEKGDVWHWKSSRTNPAGYCDDGFINDTSIFDEEDQKWIARYSDNEIGVSTSRNINADESGPEYYKPKPLNAEDAKFIFREDISERRVVEITNMTFKNGNTVPGYVLKKPVGSRGDIYAKGRWEGGRWSVEFKRKLNTGYDDDVQFDITKTYRFGIAIMDNTGGFEAFGKGHSFDLGARTLEFGGLTSEQVTQLVLIRDYLVAARAYMSSGNSELAYSEINNALGLYNEIGNIVADEDPKLYMVIKKEFGESKRKPTVNKIDALIKYVDDATLTFQGKRKPEGATWDIRLIVVWGKTQIYVFILLAVLALFPIMKSVQVGRKPEFRSISVFLFMVTTPILLEGLGRIGILTKIPILQNLSFMTNEYATLLWAGLMVTALFLARSGFGEVDKTIRSLEYYSTELEQKVEERTAELKKSEEKYRSLIETMNDGFGIIGKDKKITFINKKMQDIIGYSPDEAVGKSIFSLLDKKNKEKLNEEIVKGEKGEVSTYELEWTAKSGKKVPTLVSAAPLYDDKGNYIGSFAVITDITERKQFEQRLLQSEKLAASGKLAASIAHEINNPLFGIKNCIYILMDQVGKSEQNKKYLDMADKELDRIARIVKQLLDFYRPSAETMVLTDVNEIIDDVLVLMNTQLTSNKILVSTKLDPKLPNVMASGEQLKQVFINIVLNAQEATADGGKITIKTEASGKNIKAEFTDTGTGIPEEHLPHIFDPFFSTKKRGKGTGLGLSVSYGIIRAHNGNIDIKSKVGKGTTVIVTLPIGEG